MGQTVLLIGSGGREDALAWKLQQSPGVDAIYVAPGNAGTQRLKKAKNIPIKATDLSGLLDFALENKIGLTIVGPDDPLAMGIVNVFQERGLRIFGPTKEAAQIEASKVFSKQLMESVEVPTAPFEIFESPSDALDFVRGYFDSVTLGEKRKNPIVIKASGLALGKGAYVCRNLTEAENAIDEIMIQRLYGDSGNKLIIENFVDGPEISIHAFCDGKSFKFCPVAQDHKPIFDGNKGPNTGGMGSIAPVPWLSQKDRDLVSEKIVTPILAALREEGQPFTGLLYPGIKMSSEGPMVLEFNARFGDPETQVLMRLLKTDILEIFEACVDGRLDKIDIEWHPGFAACVVLASEGYPSPNYTKGVVIHGLEQVKILPSVKVFHAGTKLTEDGQVVTSGGRVLGVTATGRTLEEAIDRANNAVKRIYFRGMQCRKDIGQSSLRF